MSDPIKHECGIALIRLLKPLSYYQEKYGTSFYGLNKLYLLMEKQHNRGQDGAGVATVKLDVGPGKKYISRLRNNSNQPIKGIFSHIFWNFKEVEKKNPSLLQDAEWLKNNCSFMGELLMGHLRYGTHGKNKVESCHPFLRQNNWKTRSLILAGNFNMTNAHELFEQLVDLGQHPKENADTVTVLEKVGHFLDRENQRLFDKFKPKGYSNNELTDIISEQLDLKRVLTRAAQDFDGGYALMGMVGNGDGFVLRDPNGIRPAFFYKDDEVVVVASERPAIQTVFGVHHSKINEIDPGHALTIKKSGEVRLVKCREPEELKRCSFERIYFSRGTDKDIYQERKKLGFLTAPAVLKEVNYDIENTVFSFIPNTAEVAFYGLIEGVNDWLKDYKKDVILEKDGNFKPGELERLLAMKPRAEKVAVKDAKLRTFITEDSSRDELVSHVYDITYDSVVSGADNLVVVDDSIVRGTTLERSILSILDRLGPKKIIVVSSAPQIRYPDCYGIDMSKQGEFIAFRATVQLVKDRGLEHVMEEIYEKCKANLELPSSQQQNFVKELYGLFSYDEISNKISEIVRPKTIFSDVKVIYQTITDLHKACPNHSGDWYFSGDFPTAGGNRVANQAFVNYMERKNVRAY